MPRAKKTAPKEPKQEKTKTQTPAKPKPLTAARLAAVQEEIDGKFGAGTIVSAALMKPIRRMKTGLHGVDQITSGGIPAGQITVVWGPEKAGKSTFCYFLIGKLLNEDPNAVAVIVDAENAFDPTWCAVHCEHMDRIVVIKAHRENDSHEDPVYFERLLSRAMNTVDTYRKHGITVACVLIDSIHGLATKRELGKGDDIDLERSDVASLPLRMTQFVRIAVPMVAALDCPFILIGQARMGNLTGGHPMETLSGGRAVKHNARLILKVTRVGSKDARIKDEAGDVIGWPVKIMVEKVSGVTEGQSTEIPFIIGKGYDDLMMNVEKGVVSGIIIAKGGGNFTFHNDQVRGKHNLIQYFRDHPASYENLLAELSGDTPGSTVEEVEEEVEVDA